MLSLALMIIVINNASLNEKTVMMEVSGYCTCWKCCRKETGITASGHAAKGKIIAAPRKYAFGTVMKIPSWGTGVVMDRGGAIKAKGHRVPYVKIGHKKVAPTTCKYDRIDLLFEGPNAHQKALEWGRKVLPVTIIAEK